MATEKQREYIHNQLKQLGYIEPKLHEKAFSYLTARAKTFDSSKRLIEHLSSKLDLKKQIKIKSKLPSSYTPTGLSEFAFCPASYSIQNSFIIPKTIEEEFGVELHETYELEKFLDNLHGKRYREYKENKKQTEDDDLRKVYSGRFGEILSSNIIHRGHAEEHDSCFHSEKGKLIGNPDYIFRRKDGSQFILEEKHTWQEITKKTMVLTPNSNAGLYLRVQELWYRIYKRVYNILPLALL